MNCEATIELSQDLIIPSDRWGFCDHFEQVMFDICAISHGVMGCRNDTFFRQNPKISTNQHVKRFPCGIDYSASMGIEHMGFVLSESQ